MIQVGEKPTQSAKECSNRSVNPVHAAKHGQANGVQDAEATGKRYMLAIIAHLNRGRETGAGVG
jgi:hypothetical protein